MTSAVPPMYLQADVVYCHYSFVMDTMAKAELLKIESKVQMHVS